MTEWYRLPLYEAALLTRFGRDWPNISLWDITVEAQQQGDCVEIILLFFACPFSLSLTREMTPPGVYATLVDPSRCTVPEMVDALYAGWSEPE